MSITAGLSIPCEVRSGGLLKLFLANVDDVTSFTLTGELYSAVTMEPSKVFFEFEFEQDTAEYRENVVRENGSGKVTHEVEWFTPKLTQTNRDRLQEILEASSCGMIAIVEDANNTLWVVGFSEKFQKKRALKLLSDATLTGKAFTDLTGSTVIVMAEDTEKSRSFTGVVPV